MAGAPRKLTDDDVAEIRKLYGSKCPCCDYPLTMKTLAKRFNVSTPMVYHIVHYDRRVPKSA